MTSSEARLRFEGVCCGGILSVCCGCRIGSLIGSRTCSSDASLHVVCCAASANAARTQRACSAASSPCAGIALSAATFSAATLSAVAFSAATFSASSAAAFSAATLSAAAFSAATLSAAAFLVAFSAEGARRPTPPRARFSVSFSFCRRRSLFKASVISTSPRVGAVTGAGRASARVRRTARPRAHA